jgi:hypothetical protein
MRVSMLKTDSNSPIDLKNKGIKSDLELTLVLAQILASRLAGWMTCALNDVINQESFFNTSEANA